MRIYLLENPSAGRRGGHAFVEALVHALSRAGHRVTTYVGDAPGDLARHLLEIRTADLDALLVAGGDGTVRALLNAAQDLPPWPIGVVPTGTANLVARETRFWKSGSADDLATALPRAERWPVDVLEVTRADGSSERAITSVGIGLDGAMVHAVAVVREHGMSSGGYARWVAPVLKTFGGYGFPAIQVRPDDRPAFTTPLVIVQNSRHYGGLFSLSPTARLDSGRLDLVTVRSRTRRDLLRLGLRASTGRFHLDRQVRFATAQRVRIRTPRPLEVQIDGDAAGRTDVEVRVRPAALTLLRLPMRR